MTGKPGRSRWTRSSTPGSRNREFRRAVSMAIDRDAIIRSAYFGDGVKNWSALTPGSTALGKPRITEPDYDPSRAKRILDSLGWKDGTATACARTTRAIPCASHHGTNSDDNVRIGDPQLPRDDLAKVGLKCTPWPSSSTP